MTTTSATAETVTPSDQNGELCLRLRARRVWTLTGSIHGASVESPDDDCHEAATLIEQQAARIAELERDAGRWQYVRARATKEWECFHLGKVWFPLEIPWDKMTLDIAIDAAKDKT